MATIGFIGLGNMGAPMAGNLIRAGHRVLGFDLSETCRAAAAALGVEIAGSGAEAAGQADVVITMLPAGRHVVTAYDELVAAAKAGTLFIDSSTIDIASCKAAHDKAAAAGMLSLDAPVSGGVGGAAAGTLTFMVGGTAHAFALGQSILQPMAGRIVHCGDMSAGQAAKICNNMILGVSMIAVSEAFVLAEKLGLDHQALFDVASTSSGQCWSLTSYCPVPGPVPKSPANNGYKPGFAASLMLKDLALSQSAAVAAGVDTALGRHAHDIYADFAEAGQGAMDFSGIITAIRAKRSMK
jgi:3-hydroxyisobutyrate dehydrogenase